MACASTVAVVVPSPALSLVFDATSRTIWAPMFSSLPWSSTSLATVTPSFVTTGLPQDFSMTTLRPRGPSVTFTASASVLTPRRIAARALRLKTICFAVMAFLLWPSAAGHGEHVFLADEQVLLPVELHLGAAVLAEEDRVPDLHLEWAHLAILEDLAVADGDDLSLDGLLLGGIGDDDPPLGLGVAFQSLDDDAVLQRPDLHGGSSLSLAPAAPRPPWTRFRLAANPAKAQAVGTPSCRWLKPRGR